MTDVELIIKIPEELYKDIKEHGLCGYSSDREIVSGAIANGMPLPKGHGRLIDVKDICPHCGPYGCEHSDICDTYNAPTVIKADKAESEG